MPAVGASVIGDVLVVEVKYVYVRVDQDICAYRRSGSTVLSVLLQPCEMRPDHVDKEDEVCQYSLDIGEFSGIELVEVFQRDDLPAGTTPAEEAENVPVLVGRDEIDP